MQKDPNHSSLDLLFHCRNGADWTGAPPSMYARCTWLLQSDPTVLL
jgi:hypothetical protein